MYFCTQICVFYDEPSFDFDMDRRADAILFVPEFAFGAVPRRQTSTRFDRVGRTTTLGGLLPDLFG